MAIGESVGLIRFTHVGICLPRNVAGAGQTAGEPNMTV